MAGTIYATKEELTEAVVKLVYPNTTKSVTALGNQTAILNVVESIWAQLGSGGAGDLQAVLDLGSLAVIPGDFDVTANGTRLWITNGGIISNGLSFSFTSNSGGFNHTGVSSTTSGSNLFVSDNGYGLESKLSNDVISRLSCSPNGFNASMKNTNNGGVAMSIVGNPEPNSGYKVSREYSPTNDAAALWDIDGDLRVRTLNDGSADTEMLTVDADGIVNKVPIPEIAIKTVYIENGGGFFDVFISPDTQKGWGFTSLINGLSIKNPTAGTPLNGQTFFFRFKDSGLGGATITWDSKWVSVCSTSLPLVTVANKLTYVQFIYNEESVRWEAVNIAQES